MNLPIAQNFEIADVLKSRQAFIFDMDGTIVDLEELNYRSYADTIKKFFGKELSKDEYQKYISGTRTAKAFEDALENEGVAEFSVEELIANFRDLKGKNLTERTEEVTELKAGIEEYLKSLKESGRKLCLATSTVKEFTMLILKYYNLEQYFDFILTAEDVSRGKPDPEIYNMAIQKLAVDREQAVVFEDSQNGIAAAKSAEIFCIGILTKGVNEAYVTEADHVIEDYVKMAQIFKSK